MSLSSVSLAFNDSTLVFFEPEDLLPGSLFKFQQLGIKSTEPLVFCQSLVDG